MSSLSWETFYNTDYGCLDDAAEVWKHYIDAASEIEAKLIEDIPVLKPGAADQARDDFDGETADQVRAQAKRLCDLYLDDVDAYAGRIKALLEEVKTDFETKRGELADLFAEKSVYITAKGGPGEEHFEVDESSLYNYLSGTGSFQPMNEYEANDYEQRVREQAVDLSDRFKELMDSVRDLDDKYAADFKALNDDPPALPPYVGAADFVEKTAAFDAIVLENMLASEPPATPADISAWWDSLPEGTQQTLVEERPELIGPTGGIDAVDRDGANRLLLEGEIESRTEQIAELEAEIAAMDSGDPMRGPQLQLLEILQGQLDGAEALQSRLDSGGTGAPMFLLDFNLQTDGQAVVAVGDPDAADHTAVYVPGTTSDLQGVGGLVDDAAVLQADAQRFTPGDSTSVVMWLGYDAPDNAYPGHEGQGFPEAWWADQANAASDSLNTFLNGIDASHDGDSHTTLVGHSYGSSVIGAAASEHDLAADQIIDFGSPGLMVDHASELSVGEDNVWSARAEGDAITVPAELPALGADPMDTEDFGGHTFSSETIGEGGGEIHSGYLEADADGNLNPARENMALIITNRTGEVAP